MKLAVDFDTSYGPSGRRWSPQHMARTSFLSESDSSHRQPKRSVQLKERHASQILESSFKFSTGFVIQKFGAYAKNVKEKQAKISLLI